MRVAAMATVWVVLTTACANPAASPSPVAVVPTAAVTVAPPSHDAPAAPTETPTPTASPRNTPDTDPEPEPATEPPDESSAALDRMEIAFVGNPGQEEIRELLEQAFEIYDLEWTEDNLSRAGSALVALRQDAEANGSSVIEMDILEAMVAGGGLPGFSFPDAAGWMSAALRLEE